LRSKDRARRSPSAEIYGAPAFTPVEAALEGFEAVGFDAGLDHPYFAGAGPCTILIEEVEAIWAAIAERDDWSPLAAKLARIDAVAKAYGDAPELA
jgi:serine/tyrosine/threonine adenylyltransferase